ncbi:MAG: hypothetical protein WCC23_05300 [Acinetobacter calcoaceticus]
MGRVFDILKNSTLRYLYMEYARLEELYEIFIEHPSYEKLKQLTSSDEIKDNIGKIMMFLITKFKTKNKKLIFNNDFKILVDDKLVTLNLTESPDFEDQDKFLAWLHQQIFDQT